MLLICKLLRRDFVGVGKKELASNPLLGPLMSFAGTVFVERQNHHKALEALGPAVEALRKGMSLAIAPEGTRTTSPCGSCLLRSTLPGAAAPVTPTTTPTR